MKITIDTKEDSHEEIKKVIKLLQGMLNEPSTNVFECKNDLPEGSFNIFNSDKSSSEIPTNNILKEEKKDEIIGEENFEIETY